MRARSLACSVLLTTVSLASACLGVEDPYELDEPLYVHEGHFKKGALPGTKANANPVAGRPAITSQTFSLGVLQPGAVNVPLSGRTSAGAYSVGLRFADLGSGYFVRQVGPEDATFPDELTFQLGFDVSREIEAGTHKLALVAFDGDGRAGAQSEIEVCVASTVPDNFNVCDDTREPPEAVVSLAWDADADVDLTIIAPDGAVYDQTHRAQIDGDEKVLAHLDADSSAGCVNDGRHAEHWVWDEKPAKGAWYMYANLFDACGKSAVSFELTTYRKKAKGKGRFAFVETQSVGGTLVRTQANGGKGAPLYVAKINFP